VGWLRRVFPSSRRFPDDLRAELEAEDPLLLEEDLKTSITWRHFRAPGKRFGWRKTGTRGAIAITNRRVVVWALGGRQVDITFDASQIADLQVTEEDPDRVLFAFDAAKFHSDWSGTIEVRLRTESAPRIPELVASQARATRNLRGA
jgi:hypothetical protein